MEVIPVAGCKLSLTGHTLLIPGAGGTAGLGELAVDAVITTFGLSRAAVVQSPLIMPAAMSSAWKLPAEQQSGRLELTTAAELYQSETVSGLSVLQMRSPPVDGRRRALAKEIFAWASSAGVTQIIIVAPCALYMREDSDINAKSPLRFAHTGIGCTSDELATLLLKAGLSEWVLPLAGAAQDLELPVPAAAGAAAGGYPATVAPEETAAACNENRDLVAVQQMMHGAGLTKPLLLEAAEAIDAANATNEGIPQAFSLLAFSAASVDMRTLEQLAKAACALAAAKLGLQSAPAMKFPPSWALKAEESIKLPAMYLWN